MNASVDRGDLIWQDGKIAANYNISRTAVPFVDVHFEIMHRLIAAAGISVRHMLDLGAGDGIAVTEVMNRHAIEQATLTDFSAPMLEAARERFAGLPLDVTYIEGDFCDSSWHGGVDDRSPFDLVVSRFAIHHIPDERKRAIYKAAYEWLRPGGLFINIEHVASASALYNQAHDRLMVDCLIAGRGNDAGFDDVMVSYRERADGPANILAPVNDQLSWLRQIGFADVDCAFKCFELAVFAGRKPAPQEGSRT